MRLLGLVRRGAVRTEYPTGKRSDCERKKGEEKSAERGLRGDGRFSTVWVSGGRIGRQEERRHGGALQPRERGKQSEAIQYYLIFQVRQIKRR